MIRIRSGDTVTELAWTGENIPAARLLAQAGLYPDYPCGGQGRCGKCRVPVNGVPRLACRVYPADGDTVTLPVGCGTRATWSTGSPSRAIS